jgi:hypothetical protein
MKNKQPLYQPHALPFCDYPKAKDIDQHGLQQLPAEILPVDFSKASRYRSYQYKPVLATTLDFDHLLQLARVIAKSFALRESMFRHLNLPSHPSRTLSDITHWDTFGTEAFGEWSWESRLYWHIRLYSLTDITSPDARIRDEVLAQSLAIIDNANVIGGAISIPLSPPHDESPPQRNDAYLDAMAVDYHPFSELMGSQKTEAVESLCKQYPDFQIAYDSHKVGKFDLIARSEALPTIDTFELVAATLENYKNLGYEYVVTLASNQWTGAAFEALGGIRVHFAPFRLRKLFPESQKPIRGKFSSPDGFISAKDSGSMFYVARL